MMNRQESDILFEIEVANDKLRFLLNEAVERTSDPQKDNFTYERLREETNNLLAIAVDYASQISALLQSVTDAEADEINKEAEQEGKSHEEG